MHHLFRAPRNDHFSQSWSTESGAMASVWSIFPSPRVWIFFSFSCSYVVMTGWFALLFTLPGPFLIHLSWQQHGWCGAVQITLIADFAVTRTKVENRVSVSCLYFKWLAGSTKYYNYLLLLTVMLTYQHPRKRIPYPLHCHTGRDLWNRSSYPIAESTKTDAAEKIIIIIIIIIRPRPRDKRSIVGRLRRSPRIYAGVMTSILSPAAAVPYVIICTPFLPLLIAAAVR